MDRSPISRQDRHRACDPCRKRKIRCSRGSPCGRCTRLGLRCEYSVAKPLGRPRRRPERDEDSSISGPSPRTPSPILQDGFHDANDFSVDFPVQMPDLLTSVPFFGPSPPIPHVDGGPSWVELMQLGGLDPGELCNPGQSVSSPRREGTPRSRRLSEDASRSSSRWLPSSCSCMGLVHQQLSAMEGAVDQLHSINVLRKSTEVAETVLSCPACFDINQKPSGVSGNVQLLGSLLLAITACYGKIFSHQQHKAAESASNASPIRLFLGDDVQENHLVEVSVGGQDYWRLLKMSFSSELDGLALVCESFSARQRRLHMNGHEVCREGLPCQRLSVPGCADHPMDACPRNPGSRASFTCFRMADQVRNEIGKLQKQVASDS